MTPKQNPQVPIRPLNFTKAQADPAAQSRRGFAPLLRRFFRPAMSFVRFISGLVLRIAGYSPAKPTSPVLAVQRSKYPCDFKTLLPVPNWKQAHLTWPPYPGKDWPSNISPIAFSSTLLLDSATGSVFFVGNDSKVYNYYWEDDQAWGIQALNWNQWAGIDPGGGLKMDGGKVYCIGTDKKVYNFYYQGGAWQFNALVSNQFAPVDARGGLAFDHTGKVFAIGTNGKVYNYYWTGSSWTFVALNPGQFKSVDPRGGLTVDHTGKVFVIGVDGKVYNFYWTGSAWAFVALNPNQYATIDARGGLAVDQTGKVFAIGKDGKVYNYYWDGSAWQFQWLNPNQYATIDPVGKLLVHAGKVFAVGTDGKVYNYYWDGSAWQFQWLVPNPYALADPTGGLKIDAADKLFVIGRDGGVYNYYWMGASWAFNKLSPQQSDITRATNQLAVGDDTVYYASKAGFLQVFYYSDSRLNYSDWELSYSEAFPSTTTITDLQTYWVFQFPWGPTMSSSILAGYEWEYNWDNSFSVSSGSLHITADNQPHWARLIDGMADDAIMSDGKENYRRFDFTSGAMTTIGAYTYGLFEISCRFPAGKGFWPAFWLTGADTWPPEIDVFEFEGTAWGRCSNNLHWRINANETESCGMEYYAGENLTQAYHKYSMAWLPDKIVLYFDGQELRRIDHHVPQVPMRVIINMAIGLQYPDSATPFPSSFDIDYVRFYTHK